MVSRNKWLRLLTVLFAFSLFAAACGSSDDGDSADSGDTETEDADSGVLGDDEPEEEPEEAMEEEPEEAMEEEPEEATEEEPEEAPAGGGVTSDAVQGDGAEWWEQQVTNPVGPADESLEPVVITMTNVEGSPAGSFPEIREGAMAAAENINANLGGVNGRPIEFEVCVNGLDPAEATNCANEVADAQPNLHIQGINFFNPLMWPTITGAGIPVLQTVPIFVSDFNTPGLISTEGGCVSAFPGGAQYGVEVLESDAIAVVHSDTGPGFECFADTQERFYDQLLDENPGAFKWQGFPDASGDPTDNDAIVQNIAAFFEGAENPSVFFGIQASDCNEILSSLSSAGVEATIVMSGSCRDDSVLANPASAGVHVGGVDTITERPDLWNDYQILSFDVREAALDAFGPEAPKSAFMEVAHDVMMSAWVALTLMDNSGVDIDDGASVTDYFVNATNLFRVAGAKGQDCTTNASEFVSVCQKQMNNYVWSGPGGQFEYGPSGEEGVDVTDILRRVGESNPRPVAE